MLIAGLLPNLHSQTPPLQAGEQAAPLADLWSLFRMGGQPVGYVHETSTPMETGGTRTKIDVLVVINRLGSRVEIKGTSTYDEAEDGQLLHIQAENSSSKQKTMIKAAVQGDGLLLHTATGAKDYQRKIIFKDKLLGPEGARRKTAQMLKNVGDVAAYQTFIPEMEAVTKVTRKVLAKETLNLGTAQIAVIKAEEVLEGYPAKRTLWLDQDGRVVRQVEPGPFGATELHRSDRLAALRAAAGTELPAEMYDQTLVRSNIRLPSPRSMSRLLLRLTQKDPNLGWPEFDSPTQKIVSREGHSLLVESRQQKAGPTTTRPVADSPALHEYLTPNALIQSDDAEVRRLALQVVGNEADVGQAARKLQGWVSMNMQLDMGVAVAPASEIVRNRRGTCVAYSVLLASLLRASGIPSQLVMGTVYISGCWGGHAWVEFWTGDRWQPIDSALPGPGDCDAARLACMRSSLKNGMGPHMGSLLQLYSNVAISIAEFDGEGHSTRVPVSAKPFQIDGNTYRSPWLGVEITKPASFRFAKMDAVYPDSTILEILGPTGAVVRLRQEGMHRNSTAEAACKSCLRELKLDGPETRQRVAERDAIVSATLRKAGLAFVDRTDVWVLTAEGESAAKLLTEIGASLKINR